MSDKNDKKTPKTLTDDEIVTDSRLSRRSSLLMIGAGVVGTAVAAAVGLQGREARAEGNDADSGPGEDQPGHGRTGYSDRDSGGNEDRPGHGVCPLRNTTDADSGAGHDAPGHGRGPCHQ